MRWPRLFGIAARLSWAIVAFLIAHDVTYRLLAPTGSSAGHGHHGHHGHGSDYLADTGHSYLGLLQGLAPFAVALALVGVAGLAGRRIDRRAVGQTAAMAAAAFPIIEVLERVAAGADIAWWLVAAGAGIQLAVVASMAMFSAVAPRLLAVPALPGLGAVIDFAARVSSVSFTATPVAAATGWSTAAPTRGPPRI